MSTITTKAATIPATIAEQGRHLLIDPIQGRRHKAQTTTRRRRRMRGGGIVLATAGIYRYRGIIKMYGSEFASYIKNIRTKQISDQPIASTPPMPETPANIDLTRASTNTRV